VGPYQLLEVCEKLVRDKGLLYYIFTLFLVWWKKFRRGFSLPHSKYFIAVDLLTWRQKMDSASQGDEEVEGHESRVVNEEDTGHHLPSASRFHNGVLTIGCCGT
jgi:hypothetical protein